MSVGPVAVVPCGAVLPAVNRVVPLSRRPLATDPLRSQPGVRPPGVSVRPQEARDELVLLRGVDTSKAASQGGTIRPEEE